MKIFFIICTCLSMLFLSAKEYNNTNYKNLTSDGFQLYPQHDLTRFLQKYAVVYDQFQNFKIVLPSGKISPEFNRGLEQLCRYSLSNKHKYHQKTAARQMMEFILLVRENLDISLKYYNIYISYRGVLEESHTRIQNALVQSDTHLKIAARNWEYAGKCFLIMTK